MATLELWTIYENPRDFPGVFVARKFVVSRYGANPTEIYHVAKSLEEIRDRLPPGLIRFPAVPNDSPGIVETWV